MAEHVSSFGHAISCTDFATATVGRNLPSVRWPMRNSESEGLSLGEMGTETCDAVLHDGDSPPPPLAAHDAREDRVGER